MVQPIEGPAAARPSRPLAPAETAAKQSRFAIRKKEGVKRRRAPDDAGSEPSPTAPPALNRSRKMPAEMAPPKASHPTVVPEVEIAPAPLVAIHRLAPAPCFCSAGSSASCRGSRSRCAAASAHRGASSGQKVARRIGIAGSSADYHAWPAEISHLSRESHHARAADARSHAGRNEGPERHSRRKAGSCSRAPRRGLRPRPASRHGDHPARPGRPRRQSHRGRGNEEGKKKAAGKKRSFPAAVAVSTVAAAKRMKNSANSPKRISSPVEEHYAAASQSAPAFDSHLKKLRSRGTHAQRSTAVETRRAAWKSKSQSPFARSPPPWASRPTTSSASSCSRGSSPRSIRHWIKSRG